MPLLSSYRRVLATPGAPALLADRPRGAAADLDGRPGHRLPRRRPGPAPTAWPASVSAAYMIANALLAIAQGRLIDTLGQRVVLATASVAFGVSTGLLIASVQADWPIAVSYAAAAVAGGDPPVGGVGGAGPLDPRPRRAGRRADRLRARGRGRRVRLHPRPDHRHGAGHRGRPGGRARHRRGPRHRRQPRLRRSAPHRAAGAPPRPRRRGAHPDAVADRPAARRRVRGARASCSAPPR